MEVGGPEAWKGYNYCAVLVLDILSLVFWLVSFALMATRVAPFADGFEICGVLYCDIEPLEGIYLTLFACLAAVAGLGGIELYAVFSPLLPKGRCMMMSVLSSVPTSALASEQTASSL